MTNDTIQQALDMILQHQRLDLLDALCRSSASQSGATAASVRASIEGGTSGVNTQGTTTHEGTTTTRRGRRFGTRGRRQAATVQQQTNGGISKPGTVLQTVGQHQQSTGQTSTGLRPGSNADKIRSVLEASGQPMTIKQIATKSRIGGKDKAASVVAAIGQANNKIPKLFTKTAPGVYALGNWAGQSMPA